jgi:TPR repeat protein
LVNAQFNLGVMYENGEGVPQDYVKAHMWLNLAASRAEDQAIRDIAFKGRDLIAARMTPDQIAEAQRMASEWAPKREPQRTETHP